MLSSRQLFLNHLAQTSSFPLMIDVEYAEGLYIHDRKGKKYLDLISGISVSSVGHRHPQVLAAIISQLDKYLHVMVYGEFIQSPQVLLAEALVNTLPEPLDNVYLVNSGSEAIEGALKLAKRFTGKTNLIGFKQAYHGSSHGALSLSGDEKFKRSFRPLLPGVRTLDFNRTDQLDDINENTAAVLVEPVQGEAGVRSASHEFLTALRNRCNDTGTLLIFDEIQSGYGRTGTFWAFEQYEVIPDILVCAKGMGGGMPIGGFISSQEIMSTLKENPVLGHITTFGGHPVSAAASLAALNVVKTGSLLNDVAGKAALFKKHLRHPAIISFRQHGLMMAVEFESFAQLKPIIDRAIELGVITDWFLFCDNSMRIAPPIIINDDQIKEACNLIIQAIEDVIT